MLGGPSIYSDQGIIVDWPMRINETTTYMCRQTLVRVFLCFFPSFCHFALFMKTKCEKKHHKQYDAPVNLVLTNGCFFKRDTLNLFLGVEMHGVET